LHNFGYLGPDGLEVFVMTSQLCVLATVLTEKPQRFLPHDAMLARYMLSSCVCPSVWHKSKFYKDGRT